MKVVASFAFIFTFPKFDLYIYFILFLQLENVTMESYDMLHKPQRGESNHLTHCSWDNVNCIGNIGHRDARHR